MNRMQWLAEAEIRKLEELYEQPSPEDDERSDEAEELRAEARKVRQTRKRDH
jgi:hypothetical protein